MVIHRLIPTIDVFVQNIGYCKALFLIEYGDQTNSMWKVRVYETGAVLNAYDDQVLVYPNQADAERELEIPEDWMPKPPKVFV